MTRENLKIGIVMDPIGSITPYKDSSLAMLLEAERRGAEIHYFRRSTWSTSTRRTSSTALSKQAR